MKSRITVTLLLAGIGSASLTAAPVVTADGPGDFCARLALSAGIKNSVAADGRSAWTANALKFSQKIFGGSVATGLNVSPVGPATAEDYRKVDDMCQADRGGAVCHLVGPLEFQFLWRGDKRLTVMSEGERATVRTIGAETACRTESP